MKIHIIRHGDPDYRNDALTELGEEEAKKLSDYMRLLPVTRLFSSPMGRARKTAEYTSRALGMEVETLPWIHEAGAFMTRPQYTGLDVPVIAWNLPRHKIDELEHLGEDWVFSNWFSHPDAEDYLFNLQDGMNRFLRNYGIRKEQDAFYGTGHVCREEIAVFCHYGSGLTAISYLLGVSVPFLWRSVWLPPSSVTTVLAEEQQDNRINFRITGLGSSTHLFHREYVQNTSGLMYNTR